MKKIVSHLFVSLIVIAFTTAKAGSGVCDTTILNDDFSSGTGWQSVGNGDVHVSNGQCNFDNVYAGTYNKVYKSLGTTLSDNYWKAEFDFSILSTNPSGKGANGELISLTAGNLDFMSYDASQGFAETDQDGIAVYLSSNSSSDNNINNWFFVIEGKKGNVRTFDVASIIYANSAISNYYLRLERSSKGKTQLSVFTDAGRTIHLAGSPVTFDIDPTITGLNTIQHGNCTPGYPSRLLNATVDNDLICQQLPARGTDVQTACGSFTWINGNTYTTSNSTASYTLTAADGGDSIVTLNLTILQPATGTDLQSACGSYTWIDGNTYTTSNSTATFTLSAANGCDSIVTLNLTILQPATGTDLQSACGSYTWIDGNTYTTSNSTASFTLTAANGCDSIVTLNLTILQPVTGTDVQSACGSYTWIDGNTYTTSNSTASFTLTAANGCDSIVTLNLTILQPATGTDLQSTCGSYTWIDGNTYTTSNSTASFTLTAANGCDSIVTLNLTILQPATGTDVQSACGSYTWIDGNTYTTSNSTASFTLTAANGCDSIVTLNLTILQPATGTDVQSACGSYTWIDGNTYTTSNSVASFTLTAANGCDSIVTLNLTILQPATGTDVQSACGSYTWIDGNTYTTSNSTASFTLTAANGCDSIVTLNLTITNLDLAVTRSVNTLSAAETGASYQWLDCSTMLPIAGENTANYNVTSIGSYAVEVNKNGCLDTSACVLVSDLVGIDEWSATNQFMLYPNPANERLYFKNNAGSPVKLRILDARGSFLFNWEENQEGISEIPLRNLAAGLYMLEVDNQHGRYVLRFEKF